jgi:hypothetical protein
MRTSTLLRLILISGIAAIFLLPQGCATSKPAVPVATEWYGDFPKDLGTIAVVAVQYLPKAGLQTPAKGPLQGAGRGALHMMNNLAIATNNSAPAFIVVGNLLMPLAAVVGGVGGAVTAESAKSVNKKEAAINEALARMKIQKNMYDAFLKKAATLPDRHFEAGGENGPRSDKEEPDYKALKSKGIDTVFEIGVRELGLETEQENQVEPQLSYYEILQTRLVDAANNKTIAEKRFACRTLPYDFAYWTANEASAFQSALNACYGELADHVAQVF